MAALFASTPSARTDIAAVAAAVRDDRLWDRHVEMAKIGAIPQNGVNRAAFSADDIAARRLLLEWARARRFAVSVDAIGNLFIRRPGRSADAAPVVTGSHMDSQPRGGRFDGIYGVLAGLEVLECLEDAGLRTYRPVEVVAWSNEEGSRFPPCTMGSLVYTGTLALSDLLEVRDEAGIPLRTALGATLDALSDVQRRPLGGQVAYYVEAHIEQGPVLDSTRTPLGVVTGIQGMRWFDVEIDGRTEHAGTVPLRLRRDAMRDAVSIIHALGEALHDPDDVTRFTVGKIVVDPNSRNSIPGHVSFSIDLRHPCSEQLDALAARIEATANSSATACSVTVTCALSEAPCEFDASVMAAIESVAGELGISFARLVSGATHDAINMARQFPTGMVFVPCEGGISHNEQENARPEDLSAGARVLAGTVVQLAETRDITP